jgi:ribosome-associated protein
VDIPITLGQFLKLARFASSGGEAKYLIAGGMVRVNGEAEQRRGRKLFSGDAVEVAGTVVVVAATSADTWPVPRS